MTGMDYVGLAYLVKEKEYNIDNKKNIYYEVIDYVYGFYYQFTDEYAFVILSGDSKGKYVSDKCNTKYKIVNFKTIEDLCAANNHCYNYNMFQDSYKEYIGKYLGHNEDGYFVIKDKKTLDSIKKSNKKYSNIDIPDMYESIRKIVVAQDEQIMHILVSLYKNQKIINLEIEDPIIKKLKDNLLIYGPTGTGKKEILKQIANFFSIPIVVEDASILFKTSDVENYISNALKELYLSSDKDIQLAQRGIIVIENFDKLAENYFDAKNPACRIDVQKSLLKLFDGTTFYIDNKKFDTSKVSIVALGTFDNMIKEDKYPNFTMEDFAEYGIIKELMINFSKRVAMNQLTKEDIKRILIESDYSPINTYKIMFDKMKINFSYDDEFIDYIATIAINQRNGAKSLKNIFDELINDAMLKIVLNDYSKIELVKPNDDENPYILTKK